MKKRIFKVEVVRNWEVKAPLDYCVDNNLDWRHFIYCHRKSILQYDLIHRFEDREIFFYRARVLWPFPFSVPYLVFRKYEKEKGRYKNIYLNLDNNLRTYLDAQVVDNGETVSMLSRYLFELPRYWSFFPGVFFWIFKRRMGKLAVEDNEMLEQRKRMGGFDNPHCLEAAKSMVEILDERFNDLFAGPSDAQFYDHCRQD